MMILSFSGFALSIFYLAGAIFFGLKFDSRIEHLRLSSSRFKAVDRFLDWSAKNSRYFAVLGILVMFWPISTLLLVVCFIQTKENIMDDLIQALQILRKYYGKRICPNFL